MDPIAELWKCLRRVRSLRFVARSQSATGWNGVGVGSVVVEPADAVLIFIESGEWRSDAGRSMRFSNVFRWSLSETGLVRLEHLRFGPTHPVFLFELAADGAGGWASVSPHLCREDCYSATLHLQESGMVLCWTIVGPNKQETIEYTYRWAAEAPLVV